MRKQLAVLVLGSPVWAQSPLSLQEAVHLALSKHPAVEASLSGVKAAEWRIHQARSGNLPKIQYLESYQRSNNPVFVFSSLLTQHRFSEQNFQVGPLNRPESINNFQSQLVIEQPVYDAGQTRNATKSAELARNVAEETQRRTEIDVIAGVVRAYYGAVLAAENQKVAQEAVRAAEADLERAEAIRQAGMSTDADVLSIRVHLAAMREQQIRGRADLDVARAALNEALGIPLETPQELVTPLTAGSAAKRTLEELERESRRARPELRQAQLAGQLAETQMASARSSLLPQVSVRGAFEADRQNLVTRGGANWFAGASMRWNLFNGFADKARIEESSQALQRARASQRQADSAIRLEVRRAFADSQAAQERIEVARAAVAMAEESLRITRNRYQNGLNNVTDLLRTETALLEAKTRYLAAVYDQRLSAVGLEAAAGALQANSEVLR